MGYVLSGIGRHGELEDGLVETDVGVGVGAQLRAEAPDRRVQRLGGVGLGALEQHVLQEVGVTLARFGLVDRTGLHHEPERHAIAGPVVVAQVVGESVVERADPHCRIDGERFRVDLQNPADRDQVGVGQRPSVGLDHTPVELVDLGPAVLVAQVGHGDTAQRVTGLHRDRPGFGLRLGHRLRFGLEGDDPATSADRVVRGGDLPAQVGRDVVGEGLLVADAQLGELDVRERVAVPATDQEVDGGQSNGITG